MMRTSMLRPAGLRSVQRLALQRSPAQALAAQRIRIQNRSLSVSPSFLNQWYNSFGSSTATYASWLVMLIVVGEYATGKLTDAVWTSNNYGKTFETVDWSKFDEFEEEGGGGGGDDDEDDDDE